MTSALARVQKLDRIGVVFVVSALAVNWGDYPVWVQFWWFNAVFFIYNSRLNLGWIIYVGFMNK